MYYLLYLNVKYWSVNSKSGHNHFNKCQYFIIHSEDIHKVPFFIVHLTSEIIFSPAQFPLNKHKAADISGDKISVFCLGEE